MKLSICWRLAACALLLFWCGASSVHAQTVPNHPGSQPRANQPEPQPRNDKAIGSNTNLSGAGAYNLPRRGYTSSMAVREGDQSFKMNDYNGAYRWYSYALKLDAKEAQAYLGLGAVNSALEHYDEAVKSYEQALALKPKMVEAHLGLGRAYFHQQLFEQAIKSFEQAIALKPKSVEAYLGIGDCYFTQKNYAEAVAAYQKILAFEAKSVTAHYNLGVTYLMMNDRAAAVEQLRILKALNKETAERFDNQLQQFDARSQ